uniref:Transmembrane domain-containing protein n=1 Tax=Trepomonas sp. PC1 TaxID=1076344 RepID=A0A146K6P8_9EUKA|eukprot:JAP92078.1 Transmembrane domain-containing protein [Trepomonas sp. PC1]
MYTTVGLIVGGVILLVYFMVSFTMGMVAQAKARKMDPILFGTFPVTQMIFHIIYGVLISVGLMINYAPLLYTGLGIFGLKIITISFLRESCAYCNTKNAQDMHNFLQQLRNTPPSISIHVECYHYHHYTDREGKHHSERRTTFSQTRYVQLTGWQDNTPPMYIIGSDPLVYLELGQRVELLGASRSILDQYCTQAYMENRFRDTHCNVTRHIHVPGLTKNNFLKRGEVPGWMNPAVFWASQFLALDVMFTCMLRAKTPHTRLQVHKFANLEPNPQFFVLLSQQVVNFVQPQQMPQLPVFVTDMTNYHQAPQLEMNKLPLITDIQPPPFELMMEAKSEAFQAPEMPVSTEQNTQQQFGQQQYQQQPYNPQMVPSNESMHLPSQQ